MEILIILFLILLNGFFSLSEVAIISARKTRLEANANRGNKAAKTALQTTLYPNKFLSTVQIGITLIGILTGVFSGESITGNLTTTLQQIPYIQNYASVLSVTIVVGLLTFFSLVIGELVPKRIGLSNPEMFAQIVAQPMSLLTKIASPFVHLLTGTTDVIINALNLSKSRDSKVTEEEIKAIIQEGTDDGEIQEIEQEIVERVFNLGDRRVSSLMTHRRDTVFLKLSYPMPQLKEVINNELHSVYPVIDEHENVLGIVLLKDLFKYLNADNFNLADYLQKPKYIAEGLSAYETLQKFKSSKVHHALVIDEYGQVQGIITMNDLLEALVGDVSDFYDTEFSFHKREDGSWLIDGQYPLHDLLHKFNLGYVKNEYPFDTLSGLILHILKRLPEVGETMEWLNFELEVLDMDGTRIDKVLLTPKEK